MSLIPQEIIAQVLDRCDIAQTIGGYIPLKKAGRNFKALCPFHNEKTPSFLVNPDKQIFHCFGCSVGGNVITFVMKQERLDFPEAVRMLASKVGVEIPVTDAPDPQAVSFKESLFKTHELAAQFYHQQLVSGKDTAIAGARDYLKGRGLTLDIVKELKLGFAPAQWDSLLNFLSGKSMNLNLIEKAGLIVPQENRSGYYDRFRNRIIFPIFDIKSRCIAFGARAMQEGIAKYINSPETPLYTKGQHLYGLHVAKDAVIQEDAVIVVEGYMDFIIPYYAGVKNIVASLGTALTIEQIRLLRRYTKNIIMLYDSDQAGESATVRSLDLLIDEGMNVKVATLVAGEDPDTFLRKFGIEEFKKRINASESLFDFKLKVLMSQYSHKTVEGKTKISAEMLPTIARFRNAVMKFSYLKQLSEVLAVAQEALIVELQKVAQPSQSETPQSPVRQPLDKRYSVLERDLLRLMLQDESCICLVKESLTLSDFQDDVIKGIISRIFELAEKGEGTSAQNVMRCTNDEKMLQLISELVASEYPTLINKEKMLQDYIRNMKESRSRQQRLTLRQEIQEAESCGDDARRDECLNRFNALLKKR